MNPFVKRSLIVAAIIAGIAGVSATAIAQGAGPQAGQPAQRMEQMHKQHTQRHAEHQTQLKAALKITGAILAAVWAQTPDDARRLWTMLAAQLKADLARIPEWLSAVGSLGFDYKLVFFDTRSETVTPAFPDDANSATTPINVAMGHSWRLRWRPVRCTRCRARWHNRALGCSSWT